jgi:hypothetical protein
MEPHPERPPTMSDLKLPEDTEALLKANELLRRMHAFCTSGERGVLSDHVRTDGFVYCTNRFIAVRAPIELWPALTEDTIDAPNVAKVWVGVEVVDRWCQIDLSAVTIPPLPFCDFCGGSGEIECPTCSHSKECEDCNGDGHVDAIQDRIPALVGENVTCARSLKLILDYFPDAVFCANHRGMGAIPWKADQVTGVLMPIRAKSEPVNVTVAGSLLAQKEGGRDGT